jgi:hypothetical protein
MISISNQSPAEGEKQVGLDSLIEFDIIDGGAGIDISSIIVEVSGVRAIENAGFLDGFNGDFSSINLEDNGIFISIDKEESFYQDQVCLVKIQVKDLDDKFYNFEYVFKVIESSPQLIFSSPSSGALVKSDQVIFLEFEDIIDSIDLSSINISINGISAVSSGSFEDNYRGNSSSIVEKDFGATVRIEPSESFRNGLYSIEYSVSDLNQNTLSGKLNYSVDLPQIILPSIFPQVEFSGFSQGIKKVANIGDGSSLALIWNKPVSRSYKGDTFCLIYENSSRLEIFDSPPKYISTSEVTEAVVKNLETGSQYFYAMRGLEAFRDSIDLSGMQEHSEGLYQIPSDTQVSDQVGENDLAIPVNSTEGYPSSGVLFINSSEVVRYESKTDTLFLIPQNGRGLNGTSKGVFIEGDSVSLFFECQDKNSVIGAGTPIFEDGYQSGREIQGIGLVVTDYEDNDKKFFQGFDFCGYHQPLPQQIFQGKNDCGSYLGGEFNKMRGMNLFDRMLNREEVLLDQVGEPVILLRRIWNGETCSCSNARKMHPKIKGCKKCYGTGYLGGYEQFNYRRRSDGRIMVMFGDTQEDLSLTSQSHLSQDYKPSCWTLPAPAIRDRDLIVRFDFNNDVEFIYEVLNITKDKLFYRHYTRQRLNLQRMDKTDIVYTINYSRNF